MVFYFTATGNSLYIILTYGHDESDSPEFTARLAEKYSVFTDYIAAIKMVDNYLPVFDMNEETAIEKNVEEQIQTAVRAVSDRQKGVPGYHIQSEAGGPLSEGQKNIFQHRQLNNCLYAAQSHLPMNEQ